MAPEVDPNQIVEVSAWTITKASDGWKLTTRGTTLDGKRFTADKTYDTLDEVFDFIRSIAGPT